MVEQSDADPSWQIDLIPANPHACAVSLAGGYPPEMFMDVGRDPTIGSYEFWEHDWSANLALLRNLLEAIVKGCYAQSIKMGRANRITAKERFTLATGERTHTYWTTASASEDALP